MRISLLQYAWSYYNTQTHLIRNKFDKKAFIEMCVGGTKYQVSGNAERGSLTITTLPVRFREVFEKTCTTAQTIKKSQFGLYLLEY